MPTFGRFTFASFPPTPLATHLPHLPDSATTLLGVLEGLLRISAQARTPAQEALRRIEEAASDGDGPRLLLPDDLSEEERGAYGVVGDEASPPTLRAMLVEMFAP